MKKIIIPILSLAFLFSCEENTAKADSKQAKIEETDSTAEKNESSEKAQYTVDLNLKSLSKDNLKSEMKFENQFLSADMWEDKLGTNTIIRSFLTETLEKQPEQDDSDFNYGKVHAYHYVEKKDGSIELLWDMNDAERQCDFDLSIGFVAKDLIISDVDKNDIAETTIVYAKACRSDVSPANMKVIMHEGEKKFALRGVMVDILPDNNTPRDIKDLDFSKHNFDVESKDFNYFDYFGRYENAKDFDGAPDSFLQHAEEVWLKHSVLDHKF